MSTGAGGGSEEKEEKEQKEKKKSIEKKRRTILVRLARAHGVDALLDIQPMFLIPALDNQRHPI